MSNVEDRDSYRSLGLAAVRCGAVHFEKAEAKEEGVRR